jgi:outer membrane cobalamin receptor
MLIKKKYYYLILILSYISIVFSQADSSRDSQFNLESIVVVGDRSESVIKESTIPTSILTRKELETLPINNLCDAISFMPGIIFANQDASGYLPIAITRGFYGGGEAEYLLFLVDGIPINDLTTGLINWNFLSIGDIERIEITRGGGSGLYGDLAIGGVINVLTRRNKPEKRLGFNLNYGSHNQNSLELKTRYHVKNNDFGVNISTDKSQGYRNHSNYKKNSYGGNYNFLINQNNNLRLIANYTLIEQENSGPLTDEYVLIDHRKSNLMFENDKKDIDQFDASIKYQRFNSNRNKFTALSGFRLSNLKETRTLQLTSQIGDTQFEDQNSTVFWNQLQYQKTNQQFKIIAGLDTEYGIFDSKYLTQDHTKVLSEGTGSRIKLGTYVEGKYELSERFGTVFGVRFDKINDDGKINQEKKKKKINQKWSPRMGLHYQYSNSKNIDGHLFANWSHAFKAPTLNQLYDSRQINFYYQNFNYSNPSLVPQISTNYDAGINQRISSSSLDVSTEFTLAFYSMDIKNEIDFDMATFKYDNISESQHKGIEISTGIYGLNRFRYNNTINLSEVSFGTGDQKENMIKNIPKISYTNRLSIQFRDNLNIFIAQRYFGSVFLDDANTEKLPSYSIVDCKLNFLFSGYNIGLSAFNLLDKLYFSSSYMLYDPIIQENVKFHYPGQKRNFKLSLSFNL